mmetsp:Transcript_8730/g.14861  ORF Transcript_8730/g.14861 Transcript_8730/m.14861 type:complete len:207 (+) Transcript_8730:36-656(+)
MGRVNLRIFTHPKDTSVGHSMLVCNEQGGLSDKIGGVRIQDNKTTFTELRTMIEEVEINGMRRRTQFFPEVLYHMMNSPNPHGWAPEQLRHYHFGLIEAPGQPPALVPAAAEGRRVTELVPDLVAQDVILVPQSQASSPGSSRCTGSLLMASAPQSLLGKHHSKKEGIKVVMQIGLQGGEMPPPQIVVVIVVAKCRSILPWRKGGK